MIGDDVRAVTTHLRFTRQGPLVLLFYDGFERQAREGRIGGWRSNLRGMLRAASRRLRGLQIDTGFHVAFLGLCDALRSVGCDVRVNDFAAARAAPDYPIGIAGYPSVLDRVRLPNPAIFGPGDPGYPDAAAEVASRPEMRAIIQPCDWSVDLYRPACGDKMMRWPVGIDLAAIPDARGEAKTLDIVVYDKIRWHRDPLEARVRDRLLRHLAARGLSYRVLRYGHHLQHDYFATLRRARALAFLCEHETQGLAYQEAMAMNVPVFAWDEGVLVDPLQRRFAADDFRVSSVPYFDARCGERFTLADVEPRFDLFWSRLADYAPRSFVAEQLGMRQAACDYLRRYDAIAAGRAGEGCES